MDFLVECDVTLAKERLVTGAQMALRVIPILAVPGILMGAAFALINHSRQLWPPKGMHS